MLIKELKDKYPLVYEAAINNCNTGCNENNTISFSFTWGNTPEDHNFWDSINVGQFDKAKEICPHLFVESPVEFKVGDWVVVLPTDKYYSSAEQDKVQKLNRIKDDGLPYQLLFSDGNTNSYEHIRKATQAEIDEATGVKSDSFVLPEKWCVAVTDANMSILNSWRKTKDADMHVELRCWLVSDAWGDNSWCSYASTLPDRYTEITFEQFKQHVLKEITSIIKEPVKEEETMFRKGDYIVLLDGPKHDDDFKLYYCYKQRENSPYISPEIDCHGSKVNGWKLHPFDKYYNNDWRYATSEEIAEYDRLGKPFDITTMNMKTTSIDMEDIQAEAKRFFPIGCKFRNTDGDEFKLINDDIVYKIMNNMIYASSGLGCLYKDGTWATLISMPLTGVLNTSVLGDVGYVDVSLKYDVVANESDYIVGARPSTPQPLLLNKTKPNKQLVNLK
jgi:hypothetical protein